MSRPLFGRVVLCLATVLMGLVMLPCAWAQHTQGRVNITVYDPKGSVVPGAKLELQDLATNDVRTAVTESAGSFSFVNLPLGKYKLKVTKDGFQTAAFDVTVEATKTTDIEATLQVGAVTQVIEVGAVSPVVDTTSNAIGSVIDMKHIENLPITGRDITQLTRLVPGYTGTWNGLPSIAQGNNVDGVMGSPSRMKFGGNSQASISPRLESIEEMTVQTDMLDVNQGFGQSSMQINFTTRRGSNDFHGRIFEDFRNSALNANSWRNNATGTKKAPFKLNDFGGSVGGPILHDKLFFFGSFSTAIQPGFGTGSNTLLTAAAQTGQYTYTFTSAFPGANPNAWTTCTSGSPNACTVNLFALMQNYNTANGTSLPTIINSSIATQQGLINKSAQFQGSTVTPTSNRNINSLTWLQTNAQKTYFPTVRVDYNTTKNIRMNLAWNRTKRIQPNANFPYFPGPDFEFSGPGNKFDAYTASYGLDWTISPTVVNQFRGGYLYNVNWFGYNSQREYVSNPVDIFWPLVGTPTNHYRPVTSFYPVINASDTLTWQKGTHTLNFGFSFYREQDHYWNPPEGIADINLGLVQGDRALDALTNVSGTYVPLPNASTSQQGEAQNLYALLTGRISSVFGRYTYDSTTGKYLTNVTAFNLNELSKAFGLFFQDSWRVLPTVTLNYGLRWDFTGDNHDLNNAYHNAAESSIYGPTAPGDIFIPGALKGNLNPTIEERPHAYNAWNKSPQPAIGLAWAPRFDNGIMRKLMGHDGTVIRASYSLRRFTVPYQYFWDNASNFGTFFYQFFTLTSNTSGSPGTFAPGSLSVGQSLPAYAVSPAAYQKVAPESQFTFVGGSGAVGVNGMKFNIGQPYTQSWTIGIQRKLGESRALEVRYNGNNTMNQWISLNLNEVNTIENGFLAEFKNAQANLAICNANLNTSCLAAEKALGIVGSSATTGVATFANLGLPGQLPLPILTGAFTGSTSGSQANSNFRSGTFITNLNTGAVGTLASTLTRLGASPYFCNLVGNSFAPCASPTQGNYKGPDGILGTADDAGAGFPINFFQANPYATGSGTGLMTDAGYSNYNSLQVDFRQRPWHGLQFDANYTWSHTLGVATPNDWTGAYTAFTLRNIRASYGPTLFDLRHVVHVSASYDLPFGKGRQFANQNAILDKVVGGWTVATITTYQSGFPFRVLGAYSTFNNIANGGVVLNGVTKDQLQSSIGVYRIPGSAFVTLIDPKYLVSQTGGGANPSFIVPNTTPGTFAPPLYLHGPHGFYSDIMLSKAVPITERWRFTFQAEFLNAFNHPVFGNGQTPISGSILGTGWSTTSGTNTPRVIELRANISF